VKVKKLRGLKGCYLTLDALSMTTVHYEADAIHSGGRHDTPTDAERRDYRANLAITADTMVEIVTEPERAGGPKERH